MTRAYLPILLSMLTLAACGSEPAGNKSEPASGGDTPTIAGTPADVAVTSKGAPRRADGYWEMGSFGSDGSPMMKQFYCVGAGSEEKYSLFDQLTVMGDCAKKDFKRTSAGWNFDIACSIFDQKMAQQGTIAGDFKTGFAMTMNVVENGGSLRKGTIQGKRIGECPATFKPGDLVNEEGKKIANLL